MIKFFKKQGKVLNFVRHQNRKDMCEDTRDVEDLLYENLILI